MSIPAQSQKPLKTKLGIKPGMKVRLIEATEIITENCSECIISSDANTTKDYIHFFVTQAENLRHTLPKLRAELTENGMIWVSWPNKSRQNKNAIESDVTEDLIRDTALQCGLVDVKICAVDDVWSGLKQVIRLKDRK